MSDVPQVPGFPNPFGVNFEELLRMLQSQGPVNMEFARKVAGEVAVTDPELGQPQREPPLDGATVSAFDDVVRAAQVAVAETTGIAETLAIPTRCVDRAEWTRATLDGLQPVLEALARALQQTPQTPEMPEMPAPGEGFGAEPGAAPDQGEAFFGMLMQTLFPMLLGVWAGWMIGQLSHHALGQYDLPLPLDGPPTQRFVVRNVDEFAHEWALPADELRYALALREVVHGAQRAVPWVRDRIVRLASLYAGAYELRPEAIEEAIGDVDLSDPSSLEGIGQIVDASTLLGAMQSQRQRPMLEELQRFVSVLEGYTDVVVETLGERMVTSHSRIDEALRRHRLERGEAAAMVDRILGLELERHHYDEGVAFCRGVVERDGLEQLNRLWASEAMMPTRAELEAPGLWIARIELPE